MFRPPTLTYKASLRRRVPWQEWHVVLPENLLSMYLYWILYLLDSTHLKNSLIPIIESSSPSTL